MTSECPTLYFLFLRGSDVTPAEWNVSVLIRFKSCSSSSPGNQRAYQVRVKTFLMKFIIYCGKTLYLNMMLIFKVMGLGCVSCVPYFFSPFYYSIAIKPSTGTGGCSVQSMAGPSLLFPFNSPLALIPVLFSHFPASSHSPSLHSISLLTLVKSRSSEIG